MWISWHNDGYMSIVIDDTTHGNGPLAKVKLSTKEAVIYTQRIVDACTVLQIVEPILTYYTLSHELGHILYQLTDKTATEEYYAHDYAYQDTRARLYYGSPLDDLYYDRLENLRTKLIHD